MKLIILCISILLFTACGESTTEDGPADMDTTQHANGVTNGAVISTDTSAMSPNTSDSTDTSGSGR